MLSEFISGFISDSTVKAAVITAVLAFSGSLFVAYFSRAQKVAEFRQLWIDCLREDCSDFISQSISMSAKINTLLQIESKIKDNPENILIRISNQKNEISDSYNEELIRSIKTMSKLILRLNKTEHQSTIELIKTIQNSYVDPKTGDANKEFTFNDALNRIEQLRDIFHDILKSEWNRVRDGETLFNLKKNINPIMIKTINIIVYTMFVFLLTLILISNFPHIYSL